jgi:hypothetical protein
MKQGIEGVENFFFGHPLFDLPLIKGEKLATQNEATTTRPVRLTTAA